MTKMKGVLRILIESALLAALVIGLVLGVRAWRGQGQGRTGGVAAASNLSSGAEPTIPDEIAPDTAYPPPNPTDFGVLEPEITEPPTPTVPPDPTSMPTPVVTPVPVSKPPFIPEVIGKDRQPFWIFYWKDNEIWQVDEQGKDRTLLLDTYETLGQWLTAHPRAGSDCCLNGLRVAISPDGQKLALVVADKDKLSVKGEPFTFSIYLFDVPSGELAFLSQGALPSWSPDGKRVAFVKVNSSGDSTDGGLWIANLETKEIYPLIKGSEDNPWIIRSWIWSPDSQMIAYRYSQGMIDQSELWVKNVMELSLAPASIPHISSDFYPISFSWSPDPQSILAYVHDWAAPAQPLELWFVSLKSGESVKLTQNLLVAGGPWSPDGKWLAFSALPLYEGENASYDLWLMSADGAQMFRLTSGQADSIIIGWSPDGTRLVFRREGLGIAIFDLETGAITSLDDDFATLFNADYAVGGTK